MEWTEKQNDTSGSEGSAKGKGRRARNELEIWKVIDEVY